MIRTAPLLLAVSLAMASGGTLAQTRAKPDVAPPGHDMNEQNMNAPGMRETMRRQEGQAARGSRPAGTPGHDMNEQNEHQPGMHERMRRESATGGAAKAPDKPGSRVVESNKEKATGRYHGQDKHNP